MKRHYERLLDKELARLWVGSNHVIVLPLGKDKFVLSADGKSPIKAKGHEFAKVMKKLPPKAGFDKLWRALKYLERQQIKK